MTRRDFTASMWLPLLHEALAEEGRFQFPLRGNSMWPTLPSECDIEVVPLSGIPRPGELIVFVSGDGLVAHRLVAHRPGVDTGELLIAQGDHRRGPDRPLVPEQVLGRVVAAYVRGRLLWPGPLEFILARSWIVRYHMLTILCRVARLFFK